MLLIWRGGGIQISKRFSQVHFRARPKNDLMRTYSDVVGQTLKNRAQCWKRKLGLRAYLGQGFCHTDNDELRIISLQEFFHYEQRRLINMVDFIGRHVCNFTHQGVNMVLCLCEISRRRHGSQLIQNFF